jgi:hypothetical protein
MIAPKDAGPDSFLSIPPPKPPGADASGFCGNMIVPIVLDRPNLYFILDASGSMSDSIPGIAGSRYSAAVDAIVSVLQAVGHRVSYGAAVFPDDSDPTASSCPAGREVFPTQPGDPASVGTTSQEFGPTLFGLLTALGNHSPSGLTPTAASIEALKGTLLSLKGRTYAFLLTDGAPNCGSLPCDAASCTPNIEGGCDQAAGVNCCDPALGIYDYRWCLDADPTVAAVQELADSGVHTFVIGLPGTDAYASVLDRVAIAGGTARATEPFYYPATSSDELSATLQQIGLAVAISCDVPLQAPPPDKELVNVYFDDTIVPFDPQDGWTWVADDGGAGTGVTEAPGTDGSVKPDGGPSVDAGGPAGVVRLVGHSCELLKGGGVIQVQVVAGCPSVTR